jgi:hypothetical protein
MSPVLHPSEVRVGDLILAEWHQGHLFHLVAEINNNQFLIVNSVGKVNGWVSGAAILGRVTQVVDPAPRPSVPIILEQLATAYRQLIDQEQPIEAEAQRLLSIAEDLRWYADRIGAERWQQMPRSNKWSLEQQVWHLTQQAADSTNTTSRPSVRYFVDRGKECVGLAAEIASLLDTSGAEPNEPNVG